MAKKPLKKNLTKWECKQGCDISKKICKHLESTLSTDLNGSQSKETEDKYKEYLISGIETSDPEYDNKAEYLEEMLRGTGLDDFRIDLVMDYYVSNVTIKEIMTKYGYVEKKAVIYLLNDTMKILRKMDTSRLKKLIGGYHGR